MTIAEEFTVGDRAELDVHIQAGRVELVRGRPGVVKVSVETQDPDMIVEQRGDLIVVSSDKSTSWLPRGSSFVVVEAPDGIDAVISAASARIESQIPLRHAEISSASGDVELTTARSAVIKTASGDARIGAIDKSLRLKSASGSLFITDRCEGTVVLASASGQVDIAAADAVLNINTVSGDVNLPRYYGEKAVVKSMSGDIRIGIPAGTNVDLDVSLLSGSLHLPDAPTEKVPSTRHTTIRAKLVSGDLRIDRI